MGKDTLNLRVEKDVKDSAEKILDELGLSMTAAVTLYLKAIARTKGIPFTLSAAPVTPTSAVKPSQPEPEKIQISHMADTKKEKALKHPVRMKPESAKVATIKGTTSFKNAIDKL